MHLIAIKKSDLFNEEKMGKRGGKDWEKKWYAICVNDINLTEWSFIT